MKTRIVLGTALLLGLALLFTLDHLIERRVAISSLICFVGLLGWCELAVLGGVSRRARGGGVLPFCVGLAGTAYFLALAWWEAARGDVGLDLLAGGLTICLFASFAVAVFRKDHKESFEPVLLTLLGVVLCGLLFSYMIRIYHHTQGTLLAVIFLLGIKGNDIAAYFTGRFLGRRKFIAVSPNKTLEGCLGALVFSVLWFGAVAGLLTEEVFPWPRGILLGIILSTASQVGDLSVSLIKRYYQVKDSGFLLPEFGGVLDLTDSFSFCGFLFWIFLET